MSVSLARDGAGVVTVTLDRPEARNALDRDLLRDLTAALDDLAADDTIRVLVLTGTGGAFCAGGDLRWMHAQGRAGGDGLRDGVRLLEDLFRAAAAFPAPVVARVNGHAFGGGLGLVACADIAVAVADARFGFPEVRLGLAPAVIAPQVVRVVGAAAARFLLTGEVFDAGRALALGLVHEVCDPAALDTTLDRHVAALLRGGPSAQRGTKALLRQITAAQAPPAAAARDLLAGLLASDEADTGVTAFLDHRPPPWAPADDRGG